MNYRLLSTADHGTHTEVAVNVGEGETYTKVGRVEDGESLEQAVERVGAQATIELEQIIASRPPAPVITDGAEIELDESKINIPDRVEALKVEAATAEAEAAEAQIAVEAAEKVE